ncbi:outer membrane beta-barrel protein [Pedobacter sp. SYSU D00535]|uniref:outer membrane beta-barrel protein n=1 Tax=Pedobacter sp. SYSU D00535 TaxID=2810308 RepID=UPI001A970FB2|nr:outer membrane beta-barrel protein [Pedobacter sp. SYSU D00535]
MPFFRYLLCLVLSISSVLTLAQNRASIKGKLLDSIDRAPLEFATVAVTEPRDSSLISYTLTTKDGAFALRNLPTDRPLKLMVSFVGYENFRKIITLEKGQTEDFGLIYLNRRSLKEVVITGERQAIVIKKDTIEFSPEAFKTRPNAVLEDLLKKLPGLQVDLDGTITVNGRKVNKITIDGKDFFASDLTIASKNINVELIDKIQVVDDREDDPDKLKDASQVDKIINLRMKKAIKKSAFGKIYGGGGSAGRFEGGGLLNFFRDTLQVSLIGFGNNVNRSAFSSSELSSMGGFDRSSGGANNSGINFGGRSWGLQQIGSGGFNVNYDIKKKLKLNLMYFYGHTVNDHENKGISQTFIKDTTLSSQSSSINTQVANRHNINGLLEWKIDTVSNIRFLPKITLSYSNSSSQSLSDNFSSSKGMINSSNNTSSGEDNGRSYEHRFNYYRRLKKKNQSITIANNVRINPRFIDQYTNGRSTFVITNKDSILNQNLRREDSGNSANIELGYRHPLTKKLIGDVSLHTSFDNNLRTVVATRLNPNTSDYDLLLPNQSSDINRDQWTYRVRPGITWNVSKEASIRAGIVFQKLDVYNSFHSLSQKLNKTYYNIFPSLRYSSREWSINYDVSSRQPGVTDLVPVELSYSTLYSYKGNPDLDQVITHNGNIYYNKFVPSSQVGISFYTNLSYDFNNIIWADRTDATRGATLSYPVNVDGTYYWNSYINFNKRFKKVKDWQFRWTSGLNSYVSKRAFLQNEQADNLNSYELRLRAGFGLGHKELIQFEPNYTIGRNINNYSVRKDKNRDFYNHGLNNQLIVHWPKKVTLELNHNFTYDAQIARGYNRVNNLLNASIGLQMLKKDRGQIKLTGYDLLDQNTGIYSWVGSNVYNTGSQLVLHRYFLLSYVYNFNKTITK